MDFACFLWEILVFWNHRRNRRDWSE